MLRGYIPIQSCVCSLIRNRSQYLCACIYICLLVGIFVQGLLYLATGRHHSVIVFASLTPRQKDEFSQRTVESGSLSFLAARERSRVKLRDMLSYRLPALSPSVFTSSDSSVFQKCSASQPSQHTLQGSIVDTVL